MVFLWALTCVVKSLFGMKKKKQSGNGEAAAAACVCLWPSIACSTYFSVWNLDVGEIIDKCVMEESPSLPPLLALSRCGPLVSRCFLQGAVSASAGHSECLLEYSCIHTVQCVCAFGSVWCYAHIRAVTGPKPLYGCLQSHQTLFTKTVILPQCINTTFFFIWS